ncbi:unnamed protein product [Symbiodinium sp. CCMP2592]|nr:unnamed protein product [Symbiodinium sp. CCMP2592]
MEIFSPPRVALRLPAGLTSAGSFDIITGSDLLTWQGQHTVLEALRTFRPRMLVSSPPCTMYSDLQRLWNFKKMKAKLRRARMKKANTLLDFGMTVCTVQGNAGRFWVHEHPNRASSWKRRTVRKLMRLKTTMAVTFDQCQVGLCLPGNPEKKIRKRTTLLTNSQHVVDLFKPLQCCCAKGAHALARGNYNGVSVARYCQAYPRRLCDLLASAALKHAQDL